MSIVRRLILRVHKACPCRSKTEEGNRAEPYCEREVCTCQAIADPDEARSIRNDPEMPPYWKPALCEWPGHQRLNDVWDQIQEDRAKAQREARKC